MTQAAFSALFDQYPPDVREVILRTLELEWRQQSYSRPAVYDELQVILEEAAQKYETRMDQD